MSAVAASTPISNRSYVRQRMGMPASREVDDPPDPNTIGGRIRVGRDRLGISQSELGRRIGVEGTTVWRYEKNRIEPSADVLVKLAAALDCSESWIMTGAERRVDMDLRPELREFLASPEGKTVTPDELQELATYRGKSTLAYHFFLQAIRSKGTRMPGDASEEAIADANAEAVEEMKRRGMKPLEKRGKHGKGKR